MPVVQPVDLGGGEQVGVDLEGHAGDDLDVALRHTLAIDLTNRAPDPSSTDVKTVERQLIARVLQETKGNKSRAALRLGLTRKQLYGRLAQYRLD